jgi:DNA-binding response OmpR family regulator
MVFLKLYDIPVPEELAEAASGNSNKKKRILIVEDDASLLQTLNAAIQALTPDSEIHLANDGFEAGKQLVTLIPDIVILDLILPGMDGFKILSGIRSDRRFDNTRVIVVSGNDAPETRSKLDAAGKADCFLPKPLDLNVLKSRILSLLEG